MHKKSPPDKKTGARNGRQATYTGQRGIRSQKRNPISINELLSKKAGLSRITTVIPMQQTWLVWLRSMVAGELAGHIVGAVPKNAELVVFADSAAWGMRLRYALAAVQSEIAARDSAISHTTVRVQMRSTPGTLKGGLE
jgi:hypothetical protein